MIRVLVRLVLLAVGLVCLTAAVGLVIDGAFGGAVMAGVFAAVGIVVYRNLAKRGSWRDDPASDRQREFADELGIVYPEKITKGELSDLISQETKQ